MAFDDPITLALLGAGAGFLDPRGGMMGGFQGALQGLHAGNEIKRKDLQSQQAQQKLTRQMDADQMLRDVLAQQQQAGDMHPLSIANAMISTGHPDLVKDGFGIQKDFRTKVKTTNKVMKDGQAFTQPVFDDGTFGDLNELPSAEKLMTVNTGNQALLVNPMTGAPTTGFNMGMAPGEAARLSQGERHHQDSMGMQNQRLTMDRRAQVQPKFQDGAFVYPPTAENPEGRIIPTEMFTPPKGSVAASKASAAKVNGLLDEAERLIPKATGSLIGSVVDSGAGALGVSTEGARGIASLKPIEAGLVMNMPRLEGPQSNLDQQLYREAAGQIGNPNIPAQTKKAAIDTIRRIQRTYPDAFGNQQGGSAAGGSNDGWGELR